MKILLILLLCCFSATIVYADNATIIFSSDKDVVVSIYQPIDGGYNDKVVSFEVHLKEKNNQKVILGFSNWEMIHCTFSNGQDCELLLFPHDEINVQVSSRGICFEGSNAAGLQFFCDEFTSVGHRLKYLNTIDAYFAEYVNQQRSIRSITPAINEEIIHPQLTKLQHLLQEKTIQPIFYEKLSKNMEMLLNGYITERMVTLLKSQSYRKVALKDSATIMHIADSIYQKHPITDDDLIKFNYYVLYIPQYLNFYYSGQPIKIPAYDTKAFGPYKVYLHAPRFMQAALLGSACMVELKYQSGEMDLPTMKRFFNEQFPQSPYVFMLNNRVKDEGKDGERVKGDIVYIEEQPETMIELAHLPELNAKYLFVDLWATWCMPCKAEFQHREELDALLSQWHNVAIVYVSLDKDEQDERWKEEIKKWDLAGFHLRASEQLTTDIRSNIYEDGQISIPRYMLISPNGEVLHKNLPPPSTMIQLKETLKRFLNQ